MLQFVREGERFGIELEIEYGKPGVSNAHDRISMTVVRGGQTKRTRPKVLEAAARTYHAAIAEQLDAGFVLELDGMPVEASVPATFVALPELERRAEQRGDDADWSALADAWSKAGDPRGDCILGQSGLVGVDDVALYMRRKTIVEGSRRIRNAHVWGVLGRDAYRVRATFRKGLVDRFVLRDEICAPGRSTAEVVTTLLASPFSRFARELHVVGGDADELERLVAASPRAGTMTVTTARV